MTTAVATQSNQRPWWLTLLTGILALWVGGLMLWGTPQAKVQTYQGLIFILGFWWVVQGFFDIISIFVDRSRWGWKLFMGIISIAAGSYILRYPLVSAIALPKISGSGDGHLGLDVRYHAADHGFQRWRLGSWCPGRVGDHLWHRTDG